MGEPMNFFAVDDIKLIIGKPVAPIMAEASDIAEYIGIYYSEDGAAAREKAEAASVAAAAAKRGDDTVSQSPAVRRANSILNASVTMRASDIHIEPFENSVRVRFRVDGVLTEKISIPPELYSAVSTRLKIMAGMDIAEKRLPQDGRIELEAMGNKYDFRVSSLPTVFGEKLVMRKLERTGFSYSRESLQFTRKENELLDAAIRAPYGIFLTTGPTGSGKTTTIYNILNELNGREKNIVTIEDPVEYILNGVNQVQVNQKAGLTFARGLRSILRQDPDIIMIGEIRDEETAAIAIRAAITGHMVLSTLHTNDAPGAVTRLMDMGVLPYLLREAVTCIVAQRLVRRLCPRCKQEVTAGAREMSMLGIDEPVKIFAPSGCELCNNIGYTGRRAVHEVLLFDENIKGEIKDSIDTEAIRSAAARSGMSTMFDNCVQAVIEGDTSVQELARIVYGKN
jgi:type IV pilus assembly protein PilB